MFTALITGKLTKAPKSGTSGKGNAWTSASVRVPIQGHREDEHDSIFVSVIAFGSEADKLSRMESGDTISVTGNAKFSSWDKDGVTQTGLNVTVSSLMTPYQLKAKRTYEKIGGEKEPDAAGEKHGSAPPAHNGVPFDDDIPF